MVFCRSGFVEVKTFLRKPMHQHDVGRNPLNSVGCQPVVFGRSQVLKKHPGQRICKERFRDSAQHWLMLDPSSIFAFLGGMREIGGPASGSKESSLQKVWGVGKTPAFSAFNIAKERLFNDLTLCEIRNCEESGSLAIVTASHLHVCSLFGTADWCELDSCTNPPTIGKSGNTLK